MDFQELGQDLTREQGPEIKIDTSYPIFYDPDDPEPDDIDFEDDQHNPFYERDVEAEQAIANKTYAKADVDEGESDTPESLGLDPKGKGKKRRLSRSKLDNTHAHTNAHTHKLMVIFSSNYKKYKRTI